MVFFAIILLVLLMLTHYHNRLFVSEIRYVLLNATYLYNQFKFYFIFIKIMK